MEITDLLSCRDEPAVSLKGSPIEAILPQDSYWCKDYKETRLNIGAFIIITGRMGFWVILIL